MEKSIKTYLKTAAKDYSSRSVNPPVVRASTILFKTMQELRKHQKDIAKERDVEHWDYGRQGTQTTVQLQKLLRGLEEAHQVFLTPTGFAAVALSIMSICRPGDEIVISSCVSSSIRSMLFFNSQFINHYIHLWANRCILDFYLRKHYQFFLLVANIYGFLND